MNTNQNTSPDASLRTHDVLLTEAQAAEILGVKPAYLTHDRFYGPTIPFVKVGKRLVRYRHSDLMRFVEASLVPVAA